MKIATGFITLRRPSSRDKVYKTKPCPYSVT